MSNHLNPVKPNGGGGSILVVGGWGLVAFYKMGVLFREESATAKIPLIDIIM